MFTTLRAILCPDAVDRPTGVDGPRVLVSLTLDQLCFTSITMDRADQHDKDYPGVTDRVLAGNSELELRKFWDTAYRDAHHLLDQPLEFETERGNVFVDAKP